MLFPARANVVSLSRRFLRRDNVRKRLLNCETFRVVSSVLSHLSASLCNVVSSLESLQLNNVYCPLLRKDMCLVKKRFMSSLLCYKSQQGTGSVCIYNMSCRIKFTHNKLASFAQQLHSINSNGRLFYINVLEIRIPPHKKSN